MSNLMQGPMSSVWRISGGVFLVALIILMVIGFSFLGAFFLALVLAVAVTAYLLIAQQRKPETAAAPKPVSAPKPATAPTSAAKPAPAPKSAAAPKPEPAPKPATPYAPAPSAGSPAKLEGPRGGKADDLKKIKGVGPKLEATLNSMGFYHFDQIANWTATEVAWVDDNLEGFKGRVSRDDWVGQARTLAAGGGANS